MFENETLTIVPTRLSQLKAIKDILNLSSTNALINFNTTTFKSLLDEIYPYSIIKNVSAPKKIISKTARFLLIKDIINQLFVETQSITSLRSFNYFTEIQNLNGFINSIIDIIDELKRAFILPNYFKDITASLNSPKFQEISAIFARYEDELRKGSLIDSTDKDIVSLNTLKHHFNSIPFLQDLKKIEIHYLNDFTPTEYEIIKTFAENGLKIELHFIGDEKKQLFAKNLAQIKNRLFRNTRLKNISFYISIPQNDTSQEISHLLNNIFLHNFKRAPSNGKIKIISANDSISEIHSICREIKQLLEDEPSLRLSEIGVIFREITENSNDIKRIFAEYDLPIFLRRGEPLSKNHIVRLVQSLFHIKRVNFEREAVLQLITQSYFSPNISSKNKISEVQQSLKVSKEKIERIIFKSCILDGDLDQWLERFDWLKSHLKQKSGKKTHPESTDAQNESALINETEIEYTKQFISFLFNQINDLVRNQKFTQFISKIEDFINTFSIKENTINVDDYNLKIKEMKQISEFYNLVEELKETAHQLNIEDKIFTANDFLDLFNQTAFNKNSSEIILPTDKIYVINPFDARGLSFKILFIAGLNEEIFPKYLSTNPILKDYERKSINNILCKAKNPKNSNIYPLQTLEEEEINEKILFFLSLATAKERLYLSSRRTDLMEKPILKSSMLEEIERIIEFSDSDKINDQFDFVIHRFDKCFTKSEINSRLAMEICYPLPKPDEKFLSENNIISLFNTLIPQSELKDSFTDIFYRIEKELLRERYFLREKENEKLLNQWVGYINSESVKKILNDEFGGNFLWGATHLEEYHTCPFKFFLKYSMKLEPFKKPVYEIEPANEGNIIHKILRDFFYTLKNDKRLPVDSYMKFKDDMLKTTDEFFNTFEQKSYVGDKDYYEVRKEKIIDYLLSSLKKEVRQTKIDNYKFKPEYFELQFGNVIQVKEPPDIDAIIIKDPSGREIYVGGLVDRVDVCSDGFRVIDYKGSASQEPKLKIEEFGNKSFQMPIYILAARKVLSGDMSEFNTEEWTFFIYKDASPDKIKKKEEENSDFFDTFFELDDKRRREIAQKCQPNLANKICEFVGRVLNGDFQVNPTDCERFCDFKQICRYVINRKLNNSKTQK